VDPALFEVRRAVQRFNSDVTAAIFGTNPEISDGEVTLNMLKAARTISEAARQVEQELAAEAQARGATLKEIGGILRLKEAGVSMYLKRSAVSDARRVQIAEENDAWQYILSAWSENIEDETEPAESFLRYGLERAVDSYLAFLEFRRYWESGEGDLALANLNKSVMLLRQSFEGWTDPGIPEMIERHAPKGLANPKHWENPAIIYVYRAILSVTIAVMASVEAVEAAERAEWDEVGPLLGKLEYYIQGAISAFNQPEAYVVFNSAIEYLRANHPYLLPSETISKEKLEELANRKYSQSVLAPGTDSKA
jgi:hypothetical protein